MGSEGAAEEASQEDDNVSSHSAFSKYKSLAPTHSLSLPPFLSRCDAEGGLGVVDSSVDNTSWLWRNSLEKSKLRSWPSVYYSRDVRKKGGAADRGDEKGAEEGGGRDVGGAAAASTVVARNDPIYAVIDKQRRRRRRNNNNIDGALTCNFAHTREQQGGPKLHAHTILQTIKNNIL